DYSYAVDYAEYQIEKTMRKNNIPGVVFALIDGEDIIISKAFGFADIETRKPATTDTIFKVGSICKIFTGIEVMKMQEEGLIDIRNPIVEYIPDFKIISRFSDSKPISVQSILEHRSGLPRSDTLLGWAWDFHPYVMKAQVESLKYSYMVYPTGYRYKYSNVGYDVLANMIEVVRSLDPPTEDSSSAFPYYMLNTMFNPLGMSDTNFGSHELMYGTPSDKPVAMGYYREKGKNIPYNQFDIINMASGNVHTTLDDMIIFTQALLTADENSLIKESLLKKMYERSSQDTGDLKDNGLTWFRNSEILGETVVFHDGTNQGFISMLAMIPEYDLGLVIMANSEEFETVRNQLVFDILDVMIESKTGIEKPEKDEPETVNLPVENLKVFTGTYLINGEEIIVSLKNDNLKARYKNFNLTLKAISENTFTFKNPLFDSIESSLVFFPGNSIEEAYMILEMGDVFFCPRYPVSVNSQPLWEEITGKYTTYARTPSEYGDNNPIGTVEITLSNGILLSSYGYGLLPIDGNKILIQSGVFHGETMEYYPDTGEIVWQHLIFKPDST
ncbi:MAG: beta-lactamase family protein, partial [Clostridiales bacterium]|nr:beta-lactamase family protein [Clostridiales bacterium]